MKRLSTIVGLVLLVAVLLFPQGCGGIGGQIPLGNRVRFTIAGKGDIVMVLYKDHAPNTVENMITLVNSQFYNGIKFHRIVPGFVAQAGDPNTKFLDIDDDRIGTGGPGYTIPFEENNLRHLRGSVSMARREARNTAGSQFFICYNDQPTLDGDYCVFGHVIEGMNVVDSLARGDIILFAVVEVGEWVN